VGQTENTLILADLERKLVSEVAWTSHADISEAKFVFDNPAIAMIHYAGEIMLVKYSQNEYVGAVRTEYFSPHLVSIGGLRDDPNFGGGTLDFDWKVLTPPPFFSLTLAASSFSSCTSSPLSPTFLVAPRCPPPPLFFFP
jgi:hypothetical protein